MILSMEAVANAIADPNRSPDNPHFLWRHKNHKKKKRVAGGVYSSEITPTPAATAPSTTTRFSWAKN